MTESPPSGPDGSHGRSVSELPRGASPRLRIGAKGLVVDRGRVLLVQERRADGSGFWTLPGGGVRPDESLVAGLRRELDEEVGADVAVGGVETVCTYRHRTRPGTVSVYTVFDCELRSTPAPNRSEGIVAHDWFRPESLPPETLPPFSHVVRARLVGPGVLDRIAD